MRRFHKFIVVLVLSTQVPELLVQIRALLQAMGPPNPWFPNPVPDLADVAARTDALEAAETEARKGTDVAVVERGLGDAGDAAFRYSWLYDDVADLILSFNCTLSSGHADVWLDNGSRTFSVPPGTSSIDLTPFSIHPAQHQPGFRWGA